ncbi:MAG: NAD-dependent epimerase/dehydratase family protein [Chitinophagaceae bacterium]|nr:MAG: NAD-dependent epimerase/dehydratase family protein [Chitinophagaceae bacterium]
MSGKTASIIGSTGMVGEQLLGQLLADETFETVRTLVRRPDTRKHPKQEVKLVDFSDTESVKLALDGSDVIFCCIGTTQKNVKGDNALYRRIDFDIPVNAARLGKETGCEKFIVITAIGASSKSSNFYLKLKGEVEDALEALKLQTVHIFQPSLLMGKRKEYRLAERAFQGVFKVVNGLFFGGWRRYRGIKGSTLATAMINAAKQPAPGFFRHTYDAIVTLAAAPKGSS